MLTRTNRVISLTKTQNSTSHISKIEKYFKEYTKHTGIQGFQYLTESRTKIEKTFWVIVMICSLSGCGYMVSQLWSKYQQTPVFVTFETSPTPISNIPFPAITICPESKFNNIYFANLSNYLKELATEDLLLESLSIEEQNQITSLLVMCELFRPSPKKFPKYLDNYDLYTVLEELQTEFKRTVPGCTWLDKNVNCTKLLMPVVTAEGICYSFNILDKSVMFRGKVYPHDLYYKVPHKSDWNIDRGYYSMSLDTYPRRALLSGEDYGLGVILGAVIKELDQTCKVAQEGFRVSLHNPLDMPSPDRHYFRIPFNQIVSATIQPKLILTSQNMERYSPEQRKCYFSHERPLKYFNVYTSINCELECFTDFVLETCKCVHFHMPRKEETKICGPGSINCLERAYEQYKLKELSYRINGMHSKCNCKSACTELSYDVEVSNSAYSMEGFSKLLPDTDQMKFGKIAKLSIFSVSFKSDYFLAYRRRELYGTSDLISNIGGLMSLFTGFSMISLVEIIYFLTLRIYYNIKLYRRWSGPDVST